MLAALTKCEQTAVVEPPKAEILFSSTTTSNADENVTNNSSLHIEPKSLSANKAIASVDNQLATNVLSLSGTTATAISSIPTFSGLPRFSIDIDQQLNNDHLTIVKRKLELQTLQRRLTYLADYYYRELLGTIAWAKQLPGRWQRKYA